MTLVKKTLKMFTIFKLEELEVYNFEIKLFGVFAELDKFWET